MSDAAPPTPPRTEPSPEGAGRGPMIALILLVILAAGGYWLTEHLRAANRIQDCVMAGRANCAPIQ